MHTNPTLREVGSYQSLWIFRRRARNRRATYEKLLLSVVAAWVALLGLSACTRSPATPQLEASKQSLEVASSTGPTIAQKVPIEGASPQAIVVTWDSQEPTVRANVLSATVQNTTDSDIKVDLKVMAGGPNGQIVTRSLGSHTLAAHQATGISVPIGDLPIQSVGASTAVSIIASYPGASIEPLTGKSIKPVTLENFSDYRHVTFDADFSQATIRTAKAQAEVNMPAYEGESGPKLAALRVYDQTTGAVEQVASPATTDKGQPAGVISIMELPPGYGGAEPTIASNP